VPELPATPCPFAIAKLGRVRTHIHRAVFRQLITPGTPVEATCIATRIRKDDDRYAIRYRFDFRADGRRYYEGDQTAFWFRTRAADPPAG
jgi:hypothetical protein